MLEVVESTLDRYDIVARCTTTGAYLVKSRAQYSLIVEPITARHWSRRKVASDEDAIERANKSLAKIQWQLLQAVPSYVEAQSRAFAAEPAPEIPLSERGQLNGDRAWSLLK